ncbi:arrestin domain-containing protein 3-like isoform X1 [Acanthaster planci]|uniref:Arrestin domain-containing protein 3-like isoform X1 n=1 Tax=Acanthaster planci TaxID=133434 RepID=A0A8B7Z223_ACAPL|nr:arrestin domain-containing protein 3-like isoform X1 [Acanthaster planci]XP_022097442.1 arrestin domain-containing protein 3-like isoform X1 [Acanthaster planci]
MAKLQVFDVVFDGNNTGIYSSGEVVRGFVRIVLGEPKKDVRGIEIKFKGEAHTHWSEGSGDHRRHYSGREVYFKEKLLCWGKGKNDPGASKLCLETGEHRFPFSFGIPNIPLPFPFESSVGWIRYKVSCKIDRPWKFNHQTERLFTVTGVPIDLNTMPQARTPSRQESSKTVCCLCCAQGPIVTKAATDKGAYVPGESIFVSGTVDNNSSREIIDLTIKLIQHVTYFSSGGHKTRRTFTVVKDKGPGCGEGDVARMDWKPLLVPSIPPTGAQGCGIIQIEYFVQFEGDISNTPLDAEVKLPVTIGTVPLFQPLYGDPSSVVIDQPSYSDNTPPPPSYHVAVDGLQEIPSKSGYDYTFGKLMYAPQYPTYNLPAQPPTWNPSYPPQ